MDIGNTLKKIRIERGLSQKEMCHDIVTTSYYSKVERGIHQISADNLLIILQKNNISVTDFFELVNLNDVYKNSLNTAISNEIEQAYYQLDVSHLKRIEENLNNIFQKNDYNYIFYTNLIKLTLFNINQDKNLLTEENKQFFKQKIFDMNNWDSFRLSLYNNMIDFYDLESNLTLINSITSKPNLIEIEPLLVETILINFIGYCIENNCDSYAAAFFSIIENMPTTPNNFFNKNMFTFFKNLVFYREIPDNSFLEKINQAVNVFNFLDMTEYGTKLHQFYQKNKKF
ncbi:helix-turn-helix domain-containing protein [Vagococcus acidifermentans]|uniref:HTH cro/C1-type domain-containing protein n=1 Tax=Vagococcus acidifermentans TaxID=564710 RepID=A0A430AN85_9ENTE|nr:Rgg/GadR/MutR family transcriptional regulator [Vagococcus acidifermentans]RSU09620.1 hypothetical protein CBF27_12080 [Vagococcus acidifermentans]